MKGKTVDAVEKRVREMKSLRRVPHATCRLQLNARFRFDDVCSLLSYWRDLGISDLYLTPILQACAGSDHGYDICQHDRIDSGLGGEEGLERLFAGLKKRKMGVILDVVPNHMGITDPCNAWWMDVLENGPGSSYASFFDIDWDPVKKELRNKVLLPILEDQYGKALENGSFKLVFEEGSFSIHCSSRSLPLAPKTYRMILEYRLDALTESLGGEDPHLQELQSIITALGYLPVRTERDLDKVTERNREKEIIKRRIGALYEASPAVREAIEGTVTEFNGVVGDPRSFDNMDALLGRQAYRPAFWRVAAEEINYRRFFDINELAAIRMESREVFEATHELIFRLVATGNVTGLRIDHADGLWDPATYLCRLQDYCLKKMLSSEIGDMDDAEVDAVITGRLDDHVDARNERPGSWPVYVIVEKILSDEETLPAEWAAAGTVGYDFLNMTNGLFVDDSREDEITRVYADFIGGLIRWDTLVNSAKKMIMLISLAGEISALSHQLERISERHRWYRDFTLDTITFAIREVIASLGIYRTYITGADVVSARDRKYMEEAVADAKRRNPRTSKSLFDFVGDTLLLRTLENFPPSERGTVVDWVMKSQQITGPVMAKGVEDTAFYIFNRLASLNEVGGSPGRFGVSVGDFHRHNEAHVRQWPCSMLAGTTHDTKRSEDVRARLNVLSEIPGEWEAVLSKWREINAARKVFIDGEPAPDANDEYLLYQTLLGVWPMPVPGQRLDMSSAEGALLCDRIVEYMGKAVKEAKVHTSWVNPSPDYDEAMSRFVSEVLKGKDAETFLDVFLPTMERIAFFGRYNSLSQLLLRLTCPGIPDIYQGSELWDLRLVDPDNRGPVDYRLRKSVLAGMKKKILRLEKEPDARTGWEKLVNELLRTDYDGRIKFYVLYRLLNFRRQVPDLFTTGGYVPLEADGAKQKHVCSFMRRHQGRSVITAVPRLVVGLTGGIETVPLGDDIWKDTWIQVPGVRPDTGFRNLFTGEGLSLQERNGSVGLNLSSVFRLFPVAFLVSEDG
jgi:(1->4)-alpha-D-glucan 1-alpha-D-glucosylmutase